MIWSMPPLNIGWPWLSRRLTDHAGELCRISFLASAARLKRSQVNGRSRCRQPFLTMASDKMPAGSVDSGATQLVVDRQHVARILPRLPLRRCPSRHRARPTPGSPRPPLLPTALVIGRAAGDRRPAPVPLMSIDLTWAERRRRARPHCAWRRARADQRRLEDIDAGLQRRRRHATVEDLVGDVFLLGREARFIDARDPPARPRRRRGRLRQRRHGARHARLTRIGRVHVQRARQARRRIRCGFPRQELLVSVLVRNVRTLRLLLQQRRLGCSLRPDLLGDAAEDVADRARCRAAVVDVDPWILLR